VCTENLIRVDGVAKSPKLAEKAEVLAAFAAHKNEVTAGYVAKRG
jgi:hypothetical protein